MYEARALDEVSQRIFDELARLGVNTLKLRVDELLPLAGSLPRLRTAARTAGARRGFKKTATTKVTDAEGVEWLVVYDVGHRLRVAGQTEPELQRALQVLSSSLRRPPR